MARAVWLFLCFAWKECSADGDCSGVGCPGGELFKCEMTCQNSCGPPTTHNDVKCMQECGTDCGCPEMACDISREFPCGCNGMCVPKWPNATVGCCFQSPPAPVPPPPPPPYCPVEAQPKAGEVAAIHYTSGCYKRQYVKSHTTIKQFACYNADTTDFPARGIFDTSVKVNSFIIHCACGNVELSLFEMKDCMGSPANVSGAADECSDSVSGGFYTIMCGYGDNVITPISV
eukprot:TRINITY_DN58582_c0_g1_i1.p1 TRINITY_DN58582_c0_g1~~TRINITY_DN58582_c0_g1_i1.p1  ORF type:complete len:231 (-),score=32.03 TRINITY_DN58582_c0_g1_i1:57-749(-)